MTYQDVLFCNSLLSNIPFTLDGKSMSAATTTDVILCQVAYQNKVKEFDAFMQEVLKKIKKDGFDERNQKMQTMTAIDDRLKSYNDWKEGDKDAEGKAILRPTKPTDAELKEADEIRKDKAAFDEEMAELDRGYRDAYNAKLKEEVATPKKLSRSTYENIVTFVGFVGDMEITPMNGTPIKTARESFLRMVGLNLVSLE